MPLIIADILARDALQTLRDKADALSWRDGALTAGAAAQTVKRNEQADLSSRLGAALRQELTAAIEAHPVFQAAVRPGRMSKLMLSRTREGGGYGAHVDNALMGTGDGRMRSDVSFTLFLSDPETYEGGALVIESAGGEEALKPAAGDLVVYPSTSIHRVEPVRAGERLAAVGWAQSLVRDQARREILFDLETVRASLRADGDAIDTNVRLTLDKTIANLLRLWAAP